MIQKHAASSLHYDFRLEVDGTLRSWADEAPSLAEALDAGHAKVAEEAAEDPG